MPTPPAAVALLELGFLDKQPLVIPTPWSWKEWQLLTSFPHAPWAPEATRATVRISERRLAKIRAFAQKFYALNSESARLKFWRQPQTHTVARDTLSDWIRLHWGTWGINKIIDKCLEAHGRGLYDVATKSGETVRHLETYD